MAIKVALAAALLVALMAVAGATTHTTTMTATSLDDEANPRYEQCSQQLQGRQFRSCQRYLSQRGGPYNGVDEEEEVLEMTTGNPGQQQQYLQECCQQLREFDQLGCGCEAIRHAVRQAQQGRPGTQTGQSEQVYERARSLPRRCNLRSQQCQFHVVFL